jgi:ATP-binding cassette subfamily B protein
VNSKIAIMRRLAVYVSKYKGRIAVAMLLLVASVGAQLVGPFIAKTIIDRHITGIEHPWYAVGAGPAPAAGVPTVTYQGETYVRGDWLGSTVAAGGAGTPPASWREVRILQANLHFYLIPLAIAFDGERKAVGTNELQIEKDGHIADYPATQLDAAALRAFYGPDIAPVFRLIGLFVLLLIASSALTFIQSYMLQAAALRIIQDMRMDIMRHIQRMPIRYFDNTPIGQVVSRLANDTEAIKELFVSFMATFVVSGVNLIGIVVALLILDAKLALLAIVMLPLFAVIMWVHLRFSKIFVTIIRARLADMNARLNELILVMPIVQAFRKEKQSVEEFEVLNHDRYVNQVKQFVVFSLSSRNIIGLIGSLVTAAVVWYFGGMSLQSAISFGVFYAFIDYLSRFYEPIIGIFDQLMNAQRAFVASERVFQLMDEPETEEQTDTDIARPQGDVEFDSVSFAYNEGTPVLRNISFKAARGETVALVGHTGSGKSSVMNLLLGFYRVEEGAIRIDGRNANDYPKQALRRHMGIVLQDPFLFAGDIKFNVSLYDRRIDEDKVRMALREVGAEEFVGQLTGGLHEPVVERGSTLSAGQRQLISFARALAYNPSILILDEATSSIDSETEHLIQKALDVLKQGRTTFIIAHRLSTIRDADQILVLHRGEIVERGNHEQLMQLQGRYYRMYQLQRGEAASA